MEMETQKVLKLQEKALFDFLFESKKQGIQPAIIINPLTAEGIVVCAHLKEKEIDEKKKRLNKFKVIKDDE